jgi:sugar lactone lactonase YvrE
MSRQVYASISAINAVSSSACTAVHPAGIRWRTAVLFVLLVLAVFMAPTAVRAQAPTLSFVGVQTTIGSGFANPVGVAVDAQGDVFIADAGNSTANRPPRVVKLPAGGEPQITLGISGLRYPVAVAVDGEGNLFISDPGNDDVVKFPNNGGPQTTVSSGLNHPAGVAVDGKGNVFIADSGNHRVLEVPAGGGTQTVVDSVLDTPTGVAVDGAGDLFIADDFGDALYKIPAGGSSPIKVASLTSPFGVAADSAGDLFVSTNNLTNMGLWEISAGGVQTLLSGESSYGQVALDAAGDIFLGNLELNRSAVKLPNANVCTAGKTSPAPCSQSLTLTYNVLSGGTVSAVITLTQGQLVPDFAGSAITCLGPLKTGNSCTVTVDFAPTAPGLRQGALQLISTTGETITNTLLYGLATGPAIGFSPNAQTTVNVTSSPSATGEFVPAGVAMDANGDVFVSDTNNNRVVEVPANGRAQVTLGDGLAEPHGLAVDGAGDVFIADTGNNRVVEVPANGGSQITLGSGLNQPHGVAVDGAGNAFIADTGNRRIVEITHDSSGEITLGDGFMNPYGVAVDANDDVFVVDGGLNEAIELPAGGGDPITVATELNSPNSVAIDPAGNLIVADTNNSRVVEFPAGGGAPINLYLASGVLPYAVAADGAGHVLIGGDMGVLELNRAVPPTLGFTSGVGKASYSQSVLVQNIGNQPLDAVTPGLTIGKNFEQVDEIGAATDCTASFSLTPGAACGLGISFTPPAAGSFTGTVVLSDNALNAQAATQTINLTGTGKALLIPVLKIQTGPFTYNGEAHPAGCKATGTGGVSVPGSCSFTYDGSSNAPINVGTYTVKASFTSTNPYYANTTGTATLTIDTVVGPPGPGPGTYYVQNVNSGMVLGVAGASTTEGANIVQWPINGSPDQIWKLSQLANGAYVFTDVNSGLVIGVSNASLNQGAVLVQWTLNGSPDQDWYLIQNGAFWSIQDVNSGLNLDISGGSTAAGADAFQWPADGGQSQLWSLTPTT